MTNQILVLVPVKPNLNPKLKRIVGNIALAIKTRNHNIQTVVEEIGPGDVGVKGLNDRCTIVAKVRNTLIQKHLTKDFTHVMWIDADIIGLDPTFPNELIERAGSGPNAVIAPMVLTYDDRAKKRFYDTAGFVTMDGKWLSYKEPFGFEQHVRPNGTVEMMGVGCVYVVPSSVYFAGARHEPREGYTEHLSVCEFAKMQCGMPVLLDTKREVFHAWLPNYGEKAH